MTISLAASSRLELKIGCFFNVSTSALSTSGVSVSRAPFFSYFGGEFFAQLVQLREIRLVKLRDARDGVPAFRTSAGQ